MGVRAGLLTLLPLLFLSCTPTPELGDLRYIEAQRAYLAINLNEVNEDFGQTLGHWGVSPGPYLVIPFLGPSSVRDGLGLAADQATALAVNVAGIPDDRSEKLEVSAFYALSKREAFPFKYGQLKSPFEYETVRFVISEARKILVEE